MSGGLLFTSPSGVPQLLSAMWESLRCHFRNVCENVPTHTHTHLKTMLVSNMKEVLCQKEVFKPSRVTIVCMCVCACVHFKVPDS